MGRPGIPFVWANFQGNSRESFADYTGGKSVVTTASVYSCVTTFLVHTRGCVVNHTSVLRGQSASWADIALKSGSWAVCGDGAWATWILVCGAILNGERAPAVLILVFPIPRAVVQHGSLWQLLAGQRLSPDEHPDGQHMDGTAQGLASNLQ